MTRLPYDCHRCAGSQCPVRDKCLRNASMSDMGPRTPIQDNSIRLTVITEADCDDFLNAD